MIGVLLTAGATLFDEFTDSIGKSQVAARKQSVYTLGFLSMFWVFIILLVSALISADKMVFNPASWPTFTIRMVLEILQSHFTVLAVTQADRSTFGFIRTLTVPLVLLVDVVLGYQMGAGQMVGIGLMVLSFTILFFNHGITRRGAWLTAFTAVNAVATISLYKYDITHFNSVQVEQGAASFIVMIYFFIAAWWLVKENPARFLFKGVSSIQAASSGISGVVLSFAYLFAAASVITAAKRAFAVMWSILSGKVYFKEKHPVIKILCFLLIAAGLVLLVI